MENEDPVYKIHLYYITWNCGDGCCSDSGYEGMVYKNSKKIYSSGDWESNHRKSSILEDLIEVIEKDLGRTPIEDEDYILLEKEMDSDHCRYDLAI